MPSIKTHFARSSKIGEGDKCGAKVSAIPARRIAQIFRGPDKKPLKRIGLWDRPIEEIKTFLPLLESSEVQ
jgi:hypothetical protein